MDVKVPEELDYRPIGVSQPSYQFSRLYPQSGGQNTNVSTGGNSTIFELPAGKPFNFARSYFQFSFVVGIATHYNLRFADFHPWFRQIRVYTRGGLQLMNLNEAHRYSRMTLKVHKKLEKLLTDFNRTYAGTANTIDEPDQSFNASCFRSGTLSANNSWYIDTITADIPYDEPKYFSSNATDNVSWTENVTVRMEDWADTILGLDKDLVFNETIIVEFVWNSTANMGFQADNPATPQTGTAAFSFANVANNIQNMRFHLAVETNPLITAGLLSKLSSPEGLSVLIDYTYNNILNVAAGTTQSVTLRITRDNGISLKRIYHSIFGTTADLNLADYDTNNSVTYTANGQIFAAAKLNTFYTNLNNVRLMQYDYDVRKGDDYKALLPILHGSSVLSNGMFLYNWLWIEDFENCSGNKCNPNEISGIDLNAQQEVKWDFVGTSVISAAYNHVSFVVCKRKVVASASGIVLI